MKVASVEQMRSMDSTAVKQYGIVEPLLMENAGLACCDVLEREFGIAQRKFVVIAGVGNNGGDGFVIARKLLSNGGQVRVFVLGDQGKYQGSAKSNLDILKKLPVQVTSLETVDDIRSVVAHSDVIIDAIFGTGLVRDVGGRYREVIEFINQQEKRIFCVDIPSGVNGDTGQIMGIAVRADVTVTFGLPKIGNLLYPGYERCGKLYVSHISFPPPLYENESLQISVSDVPQLPPRDKDGHKGSFGNALFIAGAANYFGAPYYAALSFLKAGGGYSRLAAPSPITPFIGNKGSEIVFVPQQSTSSGSISADNLEALLALSEKMDVVILGPGLSLDPETQDLVRQLVQRITKPLLIDGDGITAVCTERSILTKRSAPTILTPHLGEMSRLTDLKVSEIERNKIDVLKKIAKKLKAIVVLKGAHSLVGTPDGTIQINMSGNSGMATAGSGDVLAGTIAAMIGLGLPLKRAVATGVFIHGYAGDLAAEEIGQDGMTAQDILQYLPLATKNLRENPASLSACYFGAIRV